MYTNKTQANIFDCKVRLKLIDISFFQFSAYKCDNLGKVIGGSGIILQWMLSRVNLTDGFNKGWVRLNVQ